MYMVEVRLLPENSRVEDGLLTLLFLLGFDQIEVMEGGDETAYACTNAAAFS
jgi:hypothetical protein